MLAQKRTPRRAAVIASNETASGFVGGRKLYRRLAHPRKGPDYAIEMQGKKRDYARSGSRACNATRRERAESRQRADDGLKKRASKSIARCSRSSRRSATHCLPSWCAPRLAPRLKSSIEPRVSKSAAHQEAMWVIATWFSFF